MSNLLIEISKLSIADRIRLVQEILSTIRLEAEAITPQLTPQQEQELEKRSKALADGSAKTISWDSIEQALIRRYDLQP